MDSGTEPGISTDKGMDGILLLHEHSGTTSERALRNSDGTQTNEFGTHQIVADIVVIC